MMEVAFDDVEGIRAHISEDFGPWGQSCEVLQETIDAFAKLTTDTQWIHVDRKRAESGPFGTTIAHGFLVLSLMPAIRPESAFKLTGWNSAANYGIRALRFLQPVISDSTIHARSRLIEVEGHRRGTLLTQEVAIQGFDSERPALQFELQLLYMR